jgi:hypothetical protein
MNYTQKQSENDPRVLNAKKLFKATAILIVFIIGFSIPFFIITSIQDDAKNTRIKMDMNQLKLWAETYGLQRDNYKGLDEDREIIRVVEDIKSAGGDCSIFVNSNNVKYCAETSLTKENMGKWCADSSGQIGKGICSKETYKCY